MLIHAYLFQRMLENGQGRDLADLARKLSLARARVTQINDTRLAPDVQAEILRFSLVQPETDPLAERRVRAAIREVLCKDQRCLGRTLLKEARWHVTEGSA